MSRPALALATSLLALTGLATLDAHAGGAPAATVEEEGVAPPAEADPAPSDALAQLGLAALRNTATVEADAAVEGAPETADEPAVEAAGEVEEVVEQVLPVKHFGGY